MAWNPSPEVAVARDAAQRLGSLAKASTERCIVFYELQDGRFGYASFGRTPNLCKDAQRLAESILQFCMRTRQRGASPQAGQPTAPTADEGAR